jgi:hypothetical protein
MTIFAELASDDVLEMYVRRWFQWAASEVGAVFILIPHTSRD